MPIMSALSSLYKVFNVRQLVKKPLVALSCPCTPATRTYADKNKTDINKSKHPVQIQGTENEDRLRVRRARPADVPRVLRFVREHAATAWPGLNAPPSASHLVLCDYVARALSQGHTLLAEQQESRRGWSQIRGLALGTAVCPWDATMLDRWARCIRCMRSRRLLHLTAHCLRAPALHDKYGVLNILQVIMVVPNNSPKNTEIVHLLAKNALQRGRDVGFPVLRFDVTDNMAAKALEELKLTKEWQLTYDVLPEALKKQKTVDKDGDNKVAKDLYTTKAANDKKAQTHENNIIVYTAIIDTPINK